MGLRQPTGERGSLRTRLTKHDVPRADEDNVEVTGTREVSDPGAINRDEDRYDE